MGGQLAPFLRFLSNDSKNPGGHDRGSLALDMQFVSEEDEMLCVGIQMEDQL